MTRNSLFSKSYKIWHLYASDSTDLFVSEMHTLVSTTFLVPSLDLPYFILSIWHLCFQVISENKHILKQKKSYSVNKTFCNSLQLKVMIELLASLSKQNKPCKTVAHTQKIIV